MNIRGYIPKFVLILSGLLLISCLLPGMIPLNREPAGPMPTMEKDANKVIEALTNNNYVRLESLAQERYTAQDFAKPGTLTLTVNITDDKPTYFSYGWCAVDDATLKQNFEHIKVGLYFNDKKLGNDVVHSLSFTSNNQPCADFGVLMSEWPNGDYKLKTVATFDDKINDGMADYAAGDYVLEYNVTVKK
jgi:hypothetical protein